MSQGSRGPDVRSIRIVGAVRPAFCRRSPCSTQVGQNAYGVRWAPSYPMEAGWRPQNGIGS